MLLARQGATVYGIDVSEGALSGAGAAMEGEGLGSRWTGRVCDATRSEDVAAAVADCVARFGRIDVLVNNIGGSAPGDPVSMSEELWQRQLDLNLKTAFLGCKHVLPVMERQFEAGGRGGAIVNLSSIGCMTFQVGGRVSAAYAGVEGRRSWPSAARPPSPTSARASA